MKKQLITLFTILVALPNLFAETAASDTTIRFKNKVIKVEDLPDQVKVKVYETRNGKDTVACKQLFEGIYSDGKSYETWSVIEDIGIQLPSFGKSKNKQNHCTTGMEPHYAGVGIGFMNVSDGNNPFRSVASARLNLKVDETTEWFVNFIEHSYPILRNRLALVTGMGINWRTYRMAQNTMLRNINGETKMVMFDLADKYEYSRLKVTRITLPLLLEWQPGFIRHSYLSGGVEAGIKTYSTFKVKYKNSDGDNVRKVTDRGLNTNPLSFDIMLQAGLDNVSIFAKQSLTKIFQQGKGPDVRSGSIGFILHFN